MKLLLIDNYDSFVFNIMRYCEELGATTTMSRNDAHNLDHIGATDYDALIISPGPCGPNEAGQSVALIKKLSGQIPILGVCLGHQCIGAAFGAPIMRARAPMHGRASAIAHDGTGIFEGMPEPFTAGRYHSLIVAPPLPEMLRVTARSQEGEIMGLAHRHHATFGVQFHPESILTTHGHELMGNFLSIAKKARS